MKFFHIETSLVTNGLVICLILASTVGLIGIKFFISYFKGAEKRAFTLGSLHSFVFYIILYIILRSETTYKEYILLIYIFFASICVTPINGI